MGKNKFIRNLKTKRYHFKSVSRIKFNLKKYICSKNEAEQTGIKMKRETQN